MTAARGPSAPFVEDEWEWAIWHRPVGNFGWQVLTAVVVAGPKPPASLVEMLGDERASVRNGGRTGEFELVRRAIAKWQIVDVPAAANSQPAQSPDTAQEG